MAVAVVATSLRAAAKTIAEPLPIAMRGRYLTLRITDFELMQAMSARRSAARVKALDWSNDIGDDALGLCISGLSTDDLVE